MDYRTFLFVILHVYKALGKEIMWDTTVKFAENMTLDCVYPSTDTLTQMEWFRIQAVKRESIAIFNPMYGALIRDPYENKLYFLNSTMTANDMTLAFYNASEADLGFYSCFLYMFPSGPWEKVLRVVHSDHFEAAVPPNKNLVTTPGENITLACQHPSRQPMQFVMWEKIQPHQIDRLVICNLSQGKSYISKHQRQILTSCSQGMRSSLLIIPYVDASDSGLYRCCFRNSTGEEETFVVQLTVAHGQTSNQHIYFLAGGAVVLLLLATPLAVSTAVYCKRRRRWKRALVQQSQEAKHKVVTKYRRPISANQPSDDAREDIYVNYPAFPRRPMLRT